MKRSLTASIVALGLVASAAYASSMFITPEGRIGVGTEDPQSELEVYRTGISNLYKLSNQGNVGFNMESRGVATWRFAATTSDDFRVSRDGTGGPEFIVAGDGSVDIGYGNTTVFYIDPAGNVDIDGTLNQGSSRATKHNIVQADYQQILASLKDLSLAEWSYLNDASGARHFGPMAEDFAEIYGFGVDSAHLAPGDVAGVALAAVKALSVQLDAKDSEIETLKAEIAALRDLQQRDFAQRASLVDRLDRLETVVKVMGSVQHQENLPLKVNLSH